MGFKVLVIIVTLYALVELCSAEDNLYCIQCRRCGEELPEATECENESHVCYVEISDGEINRGCIKKDRCNGENCETCETTGCNKHLVCQACLDTSDCHRFGSMKICGGTTKFCYSRIDEKGRTQRDCASNQIANNCKGPSCETCNKPLCNGGPFPKDRLQCYQCTNCNEPYLSQAYSCFLLSEDEQCYTDWRNKRRGCFSDSNYCTYEGTPYCSKCNSSFCNDQPFKIKQETKCVKCNSWSDPVCSLKSCDYLKPALEEDRCFTLAHNHETEKGCFYDRFEDISQCIPQANCTHCTGEGCNKEANPFQCIVCRSDDNALCRNEATKVSGQNCTSQNASNRCYTEFHNNTVRRGCFEDLSWEAQQNCRQHFCQICTSPNCNNEQFDSWTDDKASLNFINLSIFFALLTIPILN